MVFNILKSFLIIMSDDKTLQKEENDHIKNVTDEIERMNKNLKLEMNKKQNIKNIINEKDIVIKELEDKINKQDKIIKYNKNDIINLNKKIDEMINNISNDLIVKENKINNFDDKLSNVQNENKEEINKLKNILENYIKEKQLAKNPRSIPLEALEILIEKMKTSICKISCNNGGNGTGFFCNISFGWTNVKVLMTNNHILNKEDISIGQKINFSI